MSKLGAEKGENPRRRDKRIPDVEWLFGYGDGKQEKKNK